MAKKKDTKQKPIAKPAIDIERGVEYEADSQGDQPLEELIAAGKPERIEDLRDQYDKIQTTREEIDAKREKWLHELAEPFIDALEELLLDTSLSTNVRDEVDALREQLRKDAYGYSKLIDVAQLQAILGLAPTAVHALLLNGRIGFALSRFYVQSIDEAKHFAKNDRRFKGRKCNDP